MNINEESVRASNPRMKFPNGWKIIAYGDEQWAMVLNGDTSECIADGIAIEKFGQIAVLVDIVRQLPPTDADDGTFSLLFRLGAHRYDLTEGTS